MIGQFLCGFLFVAMAATAMGQISPSPPALDLLVPTAGKVVRTRVEFAVTGFDAETAWGQFLDRWFDYFDRDADGNLSVAEVARAIPLPSSSGKDVPLNFAAADADASGKLTRAEVKAYLRANGFTPVVARVQSADPKVKQLGEVILRQLDRTGKGQLTQADLNLATDLLRIFDDNDDEVLSVAELLVGAPKLEASGQSDVLIVPAERGSSADTTLRLSLAAPSSANHAAAHYSLGATRLHIDSRNVTWKGPAHASRLFCLAQFDNLRGDRPHVEWKQVERDPSARLLLELFDHADRDDDGRLTDGELRRFLDLLAEGAMCQLIVTVEDRGQSLFDVLDANGDARLDYRELLDAPKRFEISPPRGHAIIPRSLNAAIQRGAAAQAFGPLPLAAAPPVAAVAIERLHIGPRWFQAMDRNHDGFVSPLEFVGSMQSFRRLDGNGDGLISSDEAIKASSASPATKADH